MRGKFFQNFSTAEAHLGGAGRLDHASPIGSSDHPILRESPIQPFVSNMVVTYGTYLSLNAGTQFICFLQVYVCQFGKDLFGA